MKGERRGPAPHRLPGLQRPESPEKIPWEEFFEKFDERGLAFLDQDKTEDGKESRFFKLVSRETAEERKAA